MQITFDPLNEDEAQAVARFLNRDTEVVELRMPAITADQITEIARSMGTGVTNVTNVLAHADRPDVGATPEVPLAPSAAPLPPDAPSFAAVDLFPTVPVVPTASVPPVPPVPQPPAVAVPPAPPAPSAPAAPANHADLDKNGLPWDERIHAGTKAKNADGSWRSRRGLNDEGLVKRVEAELRQLVANNATSAAPLSPGAVPAAAPVSSSITTADAPASASPATAPASPPVPPAPVAATVSVPPPPVTPAGPSAVPAPPVPAGAIPPAPSAATPASTPAPVINFSQLVGMMTKAIASQRLTEDQIDAELAAEGTDKTQLGALAGDPVKTQAIGTRLWNLLGGVV